MRNPFAAAVEAIKYDLAHYEKFNKDPNFDRCQERIKQCRDALSVLEAAGLLLPLLNLPEDDKWYQLTANIKRMKERPGITVDCPSIILESLPESDTGKP